MGEVALNATEDGGRRTESGCKTTLVSMKSRRARPKTRPTWGFTAKCKRVDTESFSSLGEEKVIGPELRTAQIMALWVQGEEQV